MNIPRPDSTVLLAVDLQERLVPAMEDPAPLIERNRILIQGMAALGVDVLATEQYPKGLGHTIPEITAVLPETAATVEKIDFSAFSEPAFRTVLAAKPRKTLVVSGIEAHVCVLQTVLDARNDGLDVICVADAVASRKSPERDTAFQAMRHAGAQVFSVEAVLFMLLRSAKHPAFKTISKLIR